MAVPLLHGAEQTPVRACLWSSLPCCPVLPLLPSCTGDQHVIIVTNCLKRVLRKLKSLNRFPIHFIPPGLSLGGPQPLPCSSPLCSPYLPNTQVINPYPYCIWAPYLSHLDFYVLNICSILIIIFEHSAWQAATRMPVHTSTRLTQVQYLH